MQIIRVFHPKVEILNLVLPLIFIVAVAYEFTFMIGRFSYLEVAIWRSIAAIIFLNTIHVGFTFAAWRGLPEVNDWIKRTLTQSERINIVFIVIVLAILIIGFFQAGLAERSLQKGVYALSVFMIYDIMSTIHALGQSRGISLLYNRKILASCTMSSVAQARFNAAEYFERRGVGLLIASLAISKICIWLPSISNIGTNLNSVCEWLFWGANLLTAATLFRIWTLPLHNRSNKFFHGLRYLLWPLSLKSQFAMVGLLCIHGIEYAAVYNKMATSSIRSAVERRRWFLFLCIFSALFFVLALLSPNGLIQLVLAKDEYSWLVPVINLTASFTAAATLIHFVFDRYYFRTKNMSKTLLSN